MGCFVRGVEVSKITRVGVLEGVWVGVGEGVNVTVGLNEAVDVGTVAVGNGPSRERAVSAMAVFVLAAFLAVWGSTRNGFPTAMA